MLSPRGTLSLLAAFALAATADAGAIELKPGDRIAVIGNTLADRMQHDAWLDAYLHTRFARHDLVIRHLGFAGDEVGGYTDKPDFNKRLRSAAFGSGDEWFKRVEADVVFAFFGYNESYAGEAGIDKFKADLEAFIKHTTSQKYNGKSNARVVLFSPVAHENLKTPDLPDGTANNKRLELYTLAMAEVAKRHNVAFVDLFHATQQLYAKATEPLTINGVHLNARGNEEVAKVIDTALFADPDEPKRQAAALDKVRRAAQDRNFHWFQRYRTTDGYSIYGGRAD